MVPARLNDSDVPKKLAAHVAKLRKCRLCPRMYPPVVSGGPIVSKVLLVGQAPGDKEPKLGRPFAWTAGKTLFRWFYEAGGLSEELFRSSIYMAAVCRCFPGKNPAGGDRVPSPEEVLNCSVWLDRELNLLRPALVIPVGKLAIAQFIPTFKNRGSKAVDEVGIPPQRGMATGGSIPMQKLDQIIGRKFEVTLAGHNFDLIPLPHPSGASPWHRKEPGKSLLKRALELIGKHPAFNFPNKGNRHGV